MSQSSWTATAAGRSAAICRAAPATAKESRRCGASSRRRLTSVSAALTLFAFSADNWRRPPLEVEILMLLLRKYLRRDVRRLVESGVRLKVIGRRDRLPEGLGEGDRESGNRPRAASVSNSPSRSTIGARRDANAAATGSAITRRRAPCSRGSSRSSATAGGRDVDLHGPHRRREAAVGFPAVGVRLRGIVFTGTMWPDFGAEHLRAALADFDGRERRFGGLLVAAE